MSFKVSDKVVCVQQFYGVALNIFSQETERATCAVPQRGVVYVVGGVKDFGRYGVGLEIVGVPAINPDGSIGTWHAYKFRKLSDIQAENAERMAEEMKAIQPVKML